MIDYSKTYVCPKCGADVKRKFDAPLMQCSFCGNYIEVVEDEATLQDDLSDAQFSRKVAQRMTERARIELEKKEELLNIRRDGMKDQYPLSETQIIVRVILSILAIGALLVLKLMSIAD